MFDNTKTRGKQRAQFVAEGLANMDSNQLFNLVLGAAAEIAERASSNKAQAGEALINSLDTKSIEKLLRLVGVHIPESWSDFGVHAADIAQELYEGDGGVPRRAHATDAGYDLRTAIDFSVAPGEAVKVPTGLVFNLPEDQLVLGPLRFQLQLTIEQRTGNGGKGLIPAATIVDSGYRPDKDDPNGLTFILRNIGNETLTFKRGDKVAQGLFFPVLVPNLHKAGADEIDWDTDRGAKRFGATGS